MRRKRRNKQRKLIILTSLSLLFILTVGYAAFQTNLNITAKGNIVEEEITIEELRQTKCNQTSGDGLYKDIYEEGRCIYKGENPNNYITFNDELWRIVSIESDKKIKIINTKSIGNKAFDTKGLRTTGYCSSSGTTTYGCNAWAKNNNFINGTLSGIVDKDSELNIYLNETYYNNLSENAKKYIQSGEFNVGPVKSTDVDLADTILNEKKFTSINKIALLTASEYVRASSNHACTSIKAYYYGGDSNCYTNSSKHNWIFNIAQTTTNSNKWMRLLSPSGKDAYNVLNVDNPGNLHVVAPTTETSGVVPTLYLTSNITLKGKGTKDNPYKIIN